MDVTNRDTMEGSQNKIYVKLEAQFNSSFATCNEELKQCVARDFSYAIRGTPSVTPVELIMKLFIH